MKLRGFPKILNLNHLKELRKIAKEKGLKVSFGNGCFDLIHPGHIRYLKEAKETGDIFVLGVNSDESVRKLKGEGRPFFSLAERLEILSSIIYIDFLIPFSEERPLKIIEILKPDFHCKGGDYKAEEVPEREIVEKYGGKVLIVGGEKIYSSSQIIKKIKK